MEVLAAAENSPLLVAYVIVPLIVLAAGAEQKTWLDSHDPCTTTRAQRCLTQSCDVGSGCVGMQASALVSNRP